MVTGFEDPAGTRCNRVCEKECRAPLRAYPGVAPKLISHDFPLHLISEHPKWNLTISLLSTMEPSLPLAPLAPWAPVAPPSLSRSRPQPQHVSGVDCIVAAACLTAAVACDAGLPLGKARMRKPSDIPFELPTFLVRERWNAGYCL